MVIADGVSSAACSGEGAQAAVDVIRKLCERIMNDRHLLNDIDTI